MKQDEPRSSGADYARALREAIKTGQREDPDLWLNPDTGEVEPRPGGRKA